MCSSRDVAHAGHRARAPLRAAGRPGAADRHCRSATAWRSSRTAARHTWRPAVAYRSARAGCGGAFSFYPTKNLGALGDGGAVDHQRRAVAERVRRLRNGGQARPVRSRRGRHQQPARRDPGGRPAGAASAAWRTGRRGGGRSRRRIAISCRRGCSAVPERDAGHVYHLFPVRSANRDALQHHLRAAGIETLIHYPVPLTAQPAFRVRGAGRLSGRRARRGRASFAAASPATDRRRGRARGCTRCLRSRRDVLA